MLLNLVIFPKNENYVVLCWRERGDFKFIKKIILVRGIFLNIENDSIEKELLLRAIHDIFLPLK